MSALVAPPAVADDAGGVVQGTWTVVVKVTPSPDFSTRPGPRTYRFGVGCTVGEACRINRTLTSGKSTKTRLTATANGFAWKTHDPLDCFDDVTRQLRTKHGADYYFVGNLRPTAFTERDGVRYATALRGSFDETLRISAAGKADNCHNAEGTAKTVHLHSTLIGTPVPLAAPPPGNSGTPVTVDAAAARSTGSIGPMTLPQTTRQQRSALSVAQGLRSSVPGSLMVPRDAFRHLGSRLAQDLLLVAIVALLIVFPAQLFNSTYEENQQRIDRVLSRLRPRRGASHAPPPDEAIDVGSADPEQAQPAEPAPPDRRRRLAVFVGCVLVGTLLAGFLDPKFGANPASAALVVGVFASVLVAVLVAAYAGRLFRSATHRPTQWYLQAIPSALLIAVLGVVVSRLTHFAPGYLYGVLGGAVFAVALDHRSEGRAEAAVLVSGLVLALAAWLGFGAIASAATGAGPSFPTLSADAFLGTLFIGTIEGLLFALVPLRFLPGHRVKQWSWVAWAVLAVVVLYVFVHVLLRPESGYLGTSTVASVNLTIGLFVAFGLASVLFWAWFRFRPEPVAPARSAEPTDSDVASEDEPVGVAE